MRRLLASLACLLLAISFGAGSFAHAMEAPEVAGVSMAHAHEATTDHPAADDDHGPAGGADKGYAHHHGGCHADHVGALAKCARAAGIAPIDAALFAGSASSRPDAIADPALRPPQA